MCYILILDMDLRLGLEIVIETMSEAHFSVGKVVLSPVVCLFKIDPGHFLTRRMH